MSDKNLVDRRTFLSMALRTAVSVATARDAGASPAPEPPPAAKDLRASDGPGGSKRVLTYSDFTYVGGFVLPITTKGLDLRFSRGLTHRYVGSDLRFFSAAHKSTESPSSARDGEIVEFGFPGFGAGDVFPVAPIVRYWGDIYQDKMTTGS